MGTVTRMPIVARAERIPRTAPAIVIESAEIGPITTHVDLTAAWAGYRLRCLVGFFHLTPPLAVAAPLGTAAHPLLFGPDTSPSASFRSISRAAARLARAPTYRQRA